MNAPAPLKWDSVEWRQHRDERLLGWMKGNVDAVNTVIALSTIAETWDDLHDDEAPSKDRINAAFTLALVKLQVNDFYKANEALFFSQIVTSINGWMDANELQSSASESERMHAWFLRSLGHEITHLAAFRVGGWEHMRKVSMEMRHFFMHERFDEWEYRHVRAA
ncbi:MAG TPA: hypothetical protein VJK06_06775 [Methyloceanibacter sp.]|nr:hypothetical protein [Methyloceanibacter sp.]